MSREQNTFMKNRQITDASLVANELMDGRFKSGVPSILCKLDVEKAFDKVNRSYLLSMLKGMGFGERWINGLNLASLLLNTPS